MATTKIVLQQVAAVDENTVRVGKYPRYVVQLGNSISSITAAELSNAVEAAAGSAQSAANSAGAAKTSENNAKTSESNAKASETNAAGSRAAANTAAANAKTSETNAANSAAAASTSQGAAKASENTAKASENAAKASQGAAKTSETNAKVSEDASKASENAALASKNAAADSQAAAKISETNSKTSETNSKASEIAAAQSASEAAGAVASALPVVVALVTDANLAITSGIYTTTPTTTNIPVSSVGTLQVYKASGSNNYTQEFTVIAAAANANAARTFVRVNAGTAWTTWQEIFTPKSNPYSLGTIASAPTNAATVTRLIDPAIIGLGNSILSVSGTYSDAPVGFTTAGLAGQLVTYRRPSSLGAAIVQKVITNTGVCYVRSGSANSDFTVITWHGAGQGSKDPNGWRKQYDSVFTPTPEEVGAARSGANTDITSLGTSSNTIKVLGNLEVASALKVNQINSNYRLTLFREDASAPYIWAGRTDQVMGTFPTAEVSIFGLAAKAAPTSGDLYSGVALGSILINRQTDGSGKFSLDARLENNTIRARVILDAKTGEILFDNGTVRISNNLSTTGIINTGTISSSGNIASYSSVSVNGIGVSNAVLGSGATDIFVYNSASDKVLQLKDDGSLAYSNQPIYHTGNKPTAQDVGTYTSAQIDTKIAALVPKTTTVNGKALSGNIAITFADVGAMPLDGDATRKGNIIIKSQTTNGYAGVYFVKSTSTAALTLAQYREADNSVNISNSQVGLVTIESASGTAIWNNLDLRSSQSTLGWYGAVNFRADDTNKTILAGVYQERTGDITIATNQLATPKYFQFVKGGDFLTQGLIQCVGLVQTSDRDRKDKIERIPNALYKLDQINGVTFNWKDSGLPSAGIIAQEVMEILPECINTSYNDGGGRDEDGVPDPSLDNLKNRSYGVEYSGITALTVEGIKELHSIVRDQQDQISELKELVKTLLAK